MANVLGNIYNGSSGVLNDVIYSGSPVIVVPPPVVIIPGTNRGDIAYVDSKVTNLTIGYNNYIDSAVLSGGSWNASYPLANVKSRYLSKVAKTSSAASGTQFDMDLGAAKIVKAFGLINTNISATGATYRLIGSNDSGFASLLYDSTVLSASAQTPDLIVRVGAGITARYWRMLISDASNEAGFINIGRVFIGNGFTANDNYDYGCERGFKTDTGIVTSDGDVDYFNPRSMRRTTRLTLSWLSDLEASRALVLQRIAGINKEVLLIEDPTDLTYNQQRHYLARFVVPNAISNPYHNANVQTFDFLEIVDGSI